MNNRTIDIRIARLIKRLTQHELAREVGFSQAKLSLIETGFVIPNESDKRKIAAALCLDLSEIDWPEPPRKRVKNYESETS